MVLRLMRKQMESLLGIASRYQLSPIAK
uniref:Uncharacterized protein n=1 Tax=Arundo donax TaxID=35708 RepID=A0A0A9ASV9_ARUDO